MRATRNYSGPKRGTLPADPLAKRLKMARLRLNISQIELGRKAGFDQSVASSRISQYETGVHRPNFATSIALARALRVPVAYFYCPEEFLAILLLKVQDLSAEKRAALERLIR